MIKLMMQRKIDKYISQYPKVRIKNLLPFSLITMYNFAIFMMKYDYIVVLDPLLWTFHDITNWLKWAVAQYELEKVQLNSFPSEGRTLCEFTR